MKLKETKLESDLIYEGGIFSITRDIVELPDHKTSIRDVVHHHGGVCIAAKNHKGEFFVVRQFRYGVQSILIEFPAGKLEKGENPLEAAKRELEEETGYKANDLIDLGYIDVSPAYLSEKIYLYYANELSYIGQNLDEHEFLEVETLTLSQLNQGIMDNTITDAKTIALVFKLNLLNK